MKCPKCGLEIPDKPEKFTVDVIGSNDFLCVWKGETTLLRYIHFKCPKLEPPEPPNFIFYLDIEEDG